MRLERAVEKSIIARDYAGIGTKRLDSGSWQWMGRCFTHSCVLCVFAGKEKRASIPFDIFPAVTCTLHTSLSKVRREEEEEEVIWVGSDKNRRRAGVPQHLQIYVVSHPSRHLHIPATARSLPLPSELPTYHQAICMEEGDKRKRKGGG